MSKLEEQMEKWDMEMDEFIEKELKLKLGRICNGRPAQLGLEETIELWDKYISKAKRFKKVLEIGVNTGGSSVVWGLMGAGTIVGIDRDWSLYLDIVNQDRIKFYQIDGDSTDPDVLNILYEFYELGQVDMLHIDGGHDYVTCKSDYLTYSGFVSQNGLVVFHDCGDSDEGRNGVHKVFQEFRHEWNESEVIWNGQNGFGVYKGRK